MIPKIKAVCVLLAAAMLCACGDKNTLSRIDNLSSAAETVTTTSATTASTTTAVTTKKTTTTKKKKKTGEYQMIPDRCYDIVPIIEAHKSGDLSSLDPTQDAILEAALDFIKDCDGSNMTKAEKELAIHDKMIAEIEYDSEELDALADHSKESETPYGALINKKAICSGYALTFNLLTQLMGIESMTVEGERKDGDPHMWNQVKLGQDWYCVDITWDRNHYDDGDLKLKHKFFNCTSEFMKQNSHVWDEPDCPAANGTKYSYIKMKMNAEPYYAASLYNVEQLFWLNKQNGIGELVFIPDGYYLDVSDPSFVNSEAMEEIKKLFIENDCWYLESFTEETDNGLAAMVLFRTIKEEERPEEDSSSEEESSVSESSSESESSKDSSTAESSSSKTEESSSESAKETESEKESDSSSESDDTSSVSETEEKTEQ